MKLFFFPAFFLAATVVAEDLDIGDDDSGSTKHSDFVTHVVVEDVLTCGKLVSNSMSPH
jgi:hypothetical protein